MIWSGGMGWIADFPDPSNFYGPILGCGGAVAGGWNWAKYCNEALAARAASADAIVGEDQAAARREEWRAILIDVMKDAPSAPVDRKSAASGKIEFGRVDTVCGRRPKKQKPDQA